MHINLFLWLTFPSLSAAVWSSLGCRFVCPFIKTIRDWEQKLSLVAEIIDEWKSTQTKWLYLEGIFIGGNARQTLSNVAEQFDEIDAAYRAV